MIDRANIDHIVEKESTSIPIYEQEFNISDPNDLVRFPGFGLWPYWYLEKFKHRKEIWQKSSNVSTKDETDKYEHYCNIVASMYQEENLSPDNQNQIMQSANNDESSNHDSLEHRFCSPLWDTLSCFPATPASKLRVIPCAAEIRTVIDGVEYITSLDTTQNASRKCLANGTWAEKTDYGNCTMYEPNIPVEPSGDYSDVIYMVGYALSLIALTIALIIFLKFREMRCLRNRIHINLFCTFIFTNSWWFASIIIQDHLLHSCTIHVLTSILMRYFHITAFFWMFVEGLFLFLQVIAPLHVTMVKLRHYIVIGWVLPVVVVLLWAILNFLESSSSTDEALQVSRTFSYTQFENYALSILK